jgi:hypothetical protein
MSLVSRSIPGLFGGVSQQIPAMRHPTHCEEQLNGLATLVDGLYKRPGTEHIKLLDLTGPNGASVQGSNGAAFAHVIDKGSAGKYKLILVNGNLMLYSLTTGAVQTVAFPSGKTYLVTSDPENDFRCVTVADYTFVVNKSKTVAMKAATDAANPVNVAYVNVRTAVPSVGYSVTIDGTTVTVTTGTTPTNASIASDIKAGLIAGLAAGYTVSILTDTNIVKVVKVSGAAIACKVSDGWGNIALQCVSNGVQKFADLPAAFESGYTVSVTGTADTARDTYYVKWDGAKWVETKKPAIPDSLDETTMPHQLLPDGAGGWIFEKVSTWDTRKAGDEDTNPDPSFVGNTLRDIFFFRNRLGVLSADGLVLSRAGEYFAFFAKTATTILDSDPIDLGSPTEQVNTLDWAVVYNQSLLVFADNKQQFILTSGDILSPNTARLLPSTTFETYNGTKPKTMGNKVLYASTKGNYSQLSLYRVSDDTVTNSSEDITEHVPRFVPANPRHIEVSTVTKMAVVIPRGVTKELAVFKYELSEQDQFTQRAWCTFSFEGPSTVRIIKAHWDARRLYLLLHTDTPGDTVTGGRFVLEAFDFPMEDEEDLGVPTGHRLDGRCQATFVSYDGTYSTFEVPLLSPSGLVVLRHETGAEPLPLLVWAYAMDPASSKTRLRVLGDYTGASVYVGRPYTFRYRFTEIFMRDGDAVPLMSTTLKLVKLLVRCVSTGWFKALVTPRLRDTYTYPFTGRAIGVPGQGAGQLSLSTGTVAIPVQTQAADCQITLESDSYLPCKFPYAEWVGDVNLKAQR